jgi:hypothetical protein
MAGRLCLFLDCRVGATLPMKIAIGSPLAATQLGGAGELRARQCESPEPRESSRGLSLHQTHRHEETMRFEYMRGASRVARLICE